MTRTFFADRATTLMSRRTAKYVEAMVREDFDYDAWLEKVREEEGQTNQAEATGTSGELAAAVIHKPIITPADAYARSNPPLRLLTKTIRLPRVLSRPHRQAKNQSPKARLRRWLEKVHRAWGELQTDRRRDAIYISLEEIFTIVEHYRARRRTRRLLRHAFEFASLPFDKNADAFSAVIRCTCDNTVDAKTISKYARALRYAGRRKESDTRLKTFMKKVGGVNACASLYAKHLGRNNRVAAI